MAKFIAFCYMTEGAYLEAVYNNRELKFDQELCINVDNISYIEPTDDGHAVIRLRDTANDISENNNIIASARMCAIEKAINSRDILSYV